MKVTEFTYNKSVDIQFLDSVKIRNDVLYNLYQSVEGSKTIWQQFEVRVQQPLAVLRRF